MIFSTRDLNDVPESIFGGLHPLTDDSIMYTRCSFRLDLLNKDNTISIPALFRLREDESCLNVLNLIANILLKYDEDSTLRNHVGKVRWKIIATDIKIYLKSHSLNKECIKELAPFLLPDDGSVFFCKEEIIDGILYRAIGVPYLYEQQKEFGRKWALFLTEHFQPNNEKCDVILALHASSDWIKDQQGYLSDLSNDFSRRYSNKTAVYLFHHEHDADAIAIALFKKNETLKDIWSYILQ